MLGVSFESGNEIVKRYFVDYPFHDHIGIMDPEIFIGI